MAKHETLSSEGSPSATFAGGIGSVETAASRASAFTGVHRVPVMPYWAREVARPHEGANGGMASVVTTLVGAGRASPEVAGLVEATRIATSADPNMAVGLEHVLQDLLDAVKVHAPGAHTSIASSGLDDTELCMAASKAAYELSANPKGNEMKGGDGN